MRPVIAYQRIAMGSYRPTLLVMAAIVVGVLLFFPNLDAQARSQGRRGPCRVQKPQHFLMRSSYVRHGMLDPKAHQRAINYRARHYGSIPGASESRENSVAVSKQTQSTQFFGLPVVMHEKVIPALRCVEERIRARCTGPHSSYEPRSIGGLRTENTIRQGELSNHLFGIAIDIDPNRNPCCHCVKKWQGHPKCAKPSKSPYDRADLPRCWVESFERYGFYWLGLDSLEDTMHFEFLGDPTKAR